MTPTKNKDRVRIRYWRESAGDTGKWVLSRAMTPGVAKKCIELGIYDRPTIILRGEEFEGDGK